MRQKSRKNRFFCLFFSLLAGMLLLMEPLAGMASGTSAELKSTGKKIDALQEKKEAAEEQVNALEAQESGLQGELEQLNSQLAQVSAQITDLEQQIEEKQIKIEETRKELQRAEAQKESQYESMKQRICYIYENGNSNVFEVLLSSTSMSDLLNKAEYIEALNQYDRRMLNRYEDICSQVTEKEENLRGEKESLIAMQTDMENKKEEIDSLVTDTKASIQAKQEEISTAKNTVDDYEAQIAKMKAYEEELERKKAEEAKKLAEERKKQQAASQSGGGSVTANASDLAMLAALVECEAGGEGYEGQWAVASVVVNRVRSGGFPNTISGVIYQNSQFSPVESGRFAVVLARGAGGSCVQAAQAALSGSTNVNALYFCQASSGVSGTVIGNHVFY